MSAKSKPRRLTHFVARFFQNRSRLSSPPKSVVKIVESASRISPARSPAGGIQRNMLNSRFPASVNGCGLDVSIGCRASTWIAFGSSRRHGIVRQMHVKDEGAHAVEPAATIQVAVDRKRDRFGRSGKRCRPQPPLVMDGNAEPAHQRPGIFAESLLARHQRIAMVKVFHVAFF